MTANATPQSTSVPVPPRLLDQLCQAARERGHPEPAVAAIAGWSRRFILFHGKRHPRELGLPEVGQFLESLAQTEKDPVRSLAASRDALDFLYREVLQLDLGELPLPRPPRLLDQVRQVLRVKHYALTTEDCYVKWITRFILFHNKRHPRDMGAAEVEQFLTHLAVKGHVSASTQNQACCGTVSDKALITRGGVGGRWAGCPGQLPPETQEKRTSTPAGLVKSSQPRHPP